MSGPTHEDTTTKDVDEAPLRANHATPILQADPDGVLQRRAAARASRIDSLPARNHLGEFAVGGEYWIDVAPFTVSDGFQGTGTAATTIERSSVSRRADEPAQVEAFAPIATTIDSRHPSQLRIFFSPRTSGVYEATLNTEIRWSDGRRTTSSVAIVAIAKSPDHDGPFPQVDPSNHPKPSVTNTPPAPVATPHVKHESSVALAPTSANLQLVYKRLAASRHAIFANRAIAVRAASKNLDKADPPTLEDELVASVAIGALGLASGYISARIASRLATVAAEGAEAAVENAFQTAIDDGEKEAAARVRGLIVGGGDDIDKDEFFNSEEKGLATFQEAVAKNDADIEAAAANLVEAAPADRRESLLNQKIAAAQHLEAATRPEKEAAYDTQYIQSLRSWMVVMATGELGQHAERHGSDLEDAVDMSPADHYAGKGTRGIIYVALGSRSARRPIVPQARDEAIKVKGVTQAAIKPLRGIPIRDLKMPIIASGYLNGGVVSTVLRTNEIAFGKNEEGAVFWNGHEAAQDALKEAVKTTSLELAVRVVLDEDIGAITLEKATTTP